MLLAMCCSLREWQAICSLAILLALAGQGVSLLVLYPVLHVCKVCTLVGMYGTVTIQVAQGLLRALYRRYP
jgi:hypothetical protein